MADDVEVVFTARDDAVQFRQLDCLAREIRFDEHIAERVDDAGHIGRI
ncbi:hypothetical protein HRJ34_02845 [Rhizorhabdus wittichii]|uniref:Uncharacterized protein n=1 Tax=Rhizorhabdus wittichii TaxID=160791 RepID=A0A975HEM5_9SPHN|nr:hypothetical protein [Rhizorhabdus wittichii]QTH22482.1 hypothetical protein HRJ34_02845 [Rhizorhabdus wittichii]